MAKELNKTPKNALIT